MHFVCLHVFPGRLHGFPLLGHLYFGHLQGSGSQPFPDFPYLPRRYPALFDSSSICSLTCSFALFRAPLYVARSDITHPSLVHHSQIFRLRPSGHSVCGIFEFCVEVCFRARVCVLVWGASGVRWYIHDYYNPHVRPYSADCLEQCSTVSFCLVPTRAAPRPLSTLSLSP